MDNVEEPRLENVLEELEGFEVVVEKDLSKEKSRDKLFNLRDAKVHMKRRWRKISRDIRNIFRFKKKRSFRTKSRFSVGSGWNQAKIFRALTVFLFGSVVTGLIVGSLLFAWYARDLPSPDKVVRREGFSTKIYSKDDELLYDVYGDEKRTPVKIENVPDNLKWATVAIEDKDFYKHEGFDLGGMIRGLSRLFTRGRAQGGSTLTQQLVKNGLLTSERSIPRKIKEFVLAVQIERKFNKNEILTMYLNEVPYGGTAWGVVSAAETYFGKSVSELDLVESAILAGLPQRPSVYSPFGQYPDAYIERATNVLRRMREDGYISDEQEKEAVERLDEVDFADQGQGIKAPHFVFYVVDLLEEMYGKELVEQGGLRVKTTLDLELQETAQTIVAEEVEKIADLDVGNGAAMVMEPNSGEILAMVGSKDFYNEDDDGQVNVTLSLRQPGSTIKPVTYALAFEKGYTPASMLMDLRTEFPGGVGNPPYKPQNYDGKYRGHVSLRDALGSSLNVPAVKLLALVGVEDMLDLAYRMGFETLEPTDENLARFGLSVTLGGGEVRLIDLASAYSVFANGGTKTDPVAILEVKDRDGRTMYEHKHVDGVRVLDEKVTFLINDVLSDNNARLLTFGQNSYLNMGQRPIAVKTGTTNDKRDNWTVGWSNSVMVGVWVGNNDNSEMRDVASGVTGASPIWRRIILEAVEKYPFSEFEKPDGVNAVFVDSVSGYPEHDDFPSKSEYVIAGTLPSLPDPIHQMLKVCPGQEKLATPAMVANGNYEEKEYFTIYEEDPFSGEGEENRWQQAIDEWKVSLGDWRYVPPTEYCDTDQDVAVKINYPENEKNYDGEEIEVDVDVFSNKRIEKVEIVVNGEVKETLTEKPFKTRLILGSGKFEIKAKVRVEGGEEFESGTVKIGMGGVDWDWEADPTPTPSPTPLTSPTPATSPTPSPTPDETD